MKKHFFISFMLLCSMLFVTSLYAGPNENAGIRFDLDATTYGNQNQTTMSNPGTGAYVRFDCYAIAVHNLDTYEFEVLYDSSVFEYVGCSATNPLTFEGNILESEGGTAVGWMVDTSNPGLLSIAYTLTGTDTLEAPEGEGLLADIAFQVLSDIEDTLRFGETSFYDTFGECDVITDKDEAIIEGSVSIDDPGNDTQFDESRLDHYPNPVTHTCRIEYAIRGIQRSEEVAIDIFNSKGQLVDTIHGQNGKATWDTSKHPNGVYFYKLKANNYTQINKMIVME